MHRLNAIPFERRKMRKNRGFPRIFKPCARSDRPDPGKVLSAAQVCAPGVERLGGAASMLGKRVIPECPHIGENSW
jgi:hypothetical protein